VYKGKDSLKREKKNLRMKKKKSAQFSKELVLAALLHEMNLGLNESLLPFTMCPQTPHICGPSFSRVKVFD